MTRSLSFLALLLVSALPATAQTSPPAELPESSPRGRLAESAPWDRAFVETLFRDADFRGDVLRDPVGEFLLRLPTGFVRQPDAPGGFPPRSRAVRFTRTGAEEIVVATADGGTVYRAIARLDEGLPAACSDTAPENARLNVPEGVWTIRYDGRCAGQDRLVRALGRLDAPATGRIVLVQWVRPLAAGDPREEFTASLTSIDGLESGDAVAEKLLEPARELVLQDPQTAKAGAAVDAALARHAGWPLALAMKAYAQASVLQYDRAAETVATALAGAPDDPALQRLAVEIALRGWQPDVLAKLGPRVSAFYSADAPFWLRVEMTSNVNGDAVPDRLRLTQFARVRLTQYDGLTAQPIWTTTCYDGFPPKYNALDRPENLFLVDLNGDGARDVVFPSRACGRAVVAVDRKTGRELWRFPFGKMLEHDHDLVLAGDRLVVAVRNKALLTGPELEAGGALVGLDPATGQPAWRIAAGLDPKGEQDAVQVYRVSANPIALVLRAPSRPRAALPIAGRGMAGLRQLPPPGATAALTPDPPWPAASGIADSARLWSSADRLYYAGKKDIRAVSLATGVVLWTVPSGELADGDGVALVEIPFGLLAVSLADGRKAGLTLALFDPADGRRLWLAATPGIADLDRVRVTLDDRALRVTFQPAVGSKVAPRTVSVDPVKGTVGR